MRGLACVKAQATLPERDPNSVSDDNMVEHVDVKHFSSADNLARD
jgi:hypothetical protein